MKNPCTLVTCLIDIGRESLHPDFSRDFKEYTARFVELLVACKEIPMVIYIDPDDGLRSVIEQHRPAPAKTMILSKRKVELETKFPFFSLVDSIRKNPQWLGQAGWLPNSPQAASRLYNPLVMSKMFLLNDATLYNFFDSDSFFWIDAGLTRTVGATLLSSASLFTKIESEMAEHKLLSVGFPYPHSCSTEVHGFTKTAMASMASAPAIDRVIRGGFFGGTKLTINTVNAKYYSSLEATLGAGYMGTEESVFTLLSYAHPELFDVHMVDPNGLIYKFFERINEKPAVQLSEGKDMDLYILTFNSPKQLKNLTDSIERANPELFGYCNVFVIDNSTDPLVHNDYVKFCQCRGFVHIKHANIGICGARQWAAEHFDSRNTKYIVWFEDDMLLVDRNGNSGDVTTSQICKNGFARHHAGFIKKCIKILRKERLDFLKFSFTEYYGDHYTQWAWFNLPPEEKMGFFANNDKRLLYNHIACEDGLSYAVGEVYYSNWPLIMTKDGNRKLFLENKLSHPYEQFVMAKSFRLLRGGGMRSGVLLASLINHARECQYNKLERKEI